MPRRLTRFQNSGQSHFATFCCYHRSTTDASCRIFESALDLWRSSQDVPRANANERREDFVQQWNCPTQVKTGLEWATRPAVGMVHAKIVKGGPHRPHQTLIDYTSILHAPQA